MIVSNGLTVIRVSAIGLRKDAGRTENISCEEREWCAGAEGTKEDLNRTRTACK